ncbi:MAG: ABC transporter ATP-binding protein [Desulfobacteraceae bacterium]
MLEIKNLSVFYGDAQALKDISLEVAEGRLVALVGANGAGKSTTLSAVAGLLKPRSGSVTFMDQSLAGMRPKEIVELGISLVPEGRWLFGKMTVFENLELGAYTPRARKSKADSVERVLTLFPDLKPRLQEPAMVLSGGQQQMLAIGRALMSQPKLLMLDEPSLGLAPLMVDVMFDVFETLHSQGVTILLVEQNIQQSLELAQMGYVIKTGSISLSGTGAELLKDEGVCRAFLGIGTE